MDGTAFRHAAQARDHIMQVSECSCKSIAGGPVTADRCGYRLCFEFSSVAVTALSAGQWPTAPKGNTGQCWIGFELGRALQAVVASADEIASLRQSIAEMHSEIELLHARCSVRTPLGARCAHRHERVEWQLARCAQPQQSCLRQSYVACACC